MAASREFEDALRRVLRRRYKESVVVPGDEIEEIVAEVCAEVRDTAHRVGVLLNAGVALLGVWGVLAALMQGDLVVDQGMIGIVLVLVGAGNVTLWVRSMTGGL